MRRYTFKEINGCVPENIKIMSRLLTVLQTYEMFA